MQRLNDLSRVRTRSVLDEANCFDASFFAMGAREAETLDPQYHVFLEWAVEALEVPQIDFKNGPLYVNTALANRPVDGVPPRAGLSSFGLGGTNAHIVLEEAPDADPPAPSRTELRVADLSAQIDRLVERESQATSTMAVEEDWV